MTDEERASVVAFAKAGPASLARDALPEFAERQIIAMRCIACHTRDGRESLLSTIYDADQKELESKYPPSHGATSEAFAPDQRAPMLTWAGEKLQADWMAHFIAGQIPYKPRTYIRARMPAFEPRAAAIAAGLAEEHGYSPAPVAPEKQDATLATAGRKLMGKTPNEAFACVQCHAVGKAPPLAPFEAPAVNFAYSKDRLRKEYFHRWVHNPIRIDPNTKMPAFEREDGKTTITSSFDGDARKQFEAIWQYLLSGKDITPPED
jgi:mono/diheme cytochrome c family protein